MNTLLKWNRGFGLVEVLVGLAMILIIVPTMLGWLVSSQRVVSTSERKGAATALAEEAFEAIRTLRDKSWTTNIASSATGRDYYLSLDGDQWTLTETDPGLIDELYTRTVRFDDVFRDDNDVISSQGTEDPHSRKLTVTVTWVERGITHTVVIEGYLTNFQDT